MADLTGKNLGNYRVVERIGRGGMASVYKAFQPALERYVAIKVIHEGLVADDVQFVKRFQREAKSVAALRHPNIVQVFDFGAEGDIPYMVMEFLDGDTLKAHLDKLNQSGQRISLEQVQRIFVEICSAVAYAHTQGMVHRDLKPANVMLTSRGAVLTDFGVARIIGGTRYTITGTMTGTPAYMSPEQCKGERGDERSDIYALGVMLYEVLTGQVPFEADTPLAVILKHISEPLPMPRRLSPDIPEAVEQVVLKAMAKEPGDRYQDAAAMGAALASAIDSLATGAVAHPAVPAPSSDATPAVTARVTLPLDTPEDVGQAVESLTAAPSLPQDEMSPAEAPMAAADIAKIPASPARRARIPRWVWLAGGGLLAILILASVYLNLLGGRSSEEEQPPEEAVLATQITSTGEMIADNDDSGFEIIEGDWGDCWAGECQGVSHIESFYYAEPGCVECLARFTLQVSQGGEYDVWAWWPRGDDRATDTPYTVRIGDQVDKLVVNQRDQGSAWYHLGSYTFQAGETLQVDVGGSHSGYANADAVAVTQAGSGPPTLPENLRPPVAGAIVVDNNAPGFSITSGEWGTCPYSSCDGTAFSEDFRYADPGCSECQARFEIPVEEDGVYDVWTWWPQGDDRSTDTPYTILFGDQIANLTVNQMDNGSGWYLLGRFSFQAGQTIAIEVGGSESGYANADAVAIAR